MNNTIVALLVSEHNHYGHEVCRVIFDRPFEKLGDATEAFIFFCGKRVEIYHTDFYCPDRKNFNHKLDTNRRQCVMLNHSTPTEKNHHKAILKEVGIRFIVSSAELAD